MLEGLYCVFAWGLVYLGSLCVFKTEGPICVCVCYEQQLGGCPVTDGCSHGRLSALGKQPAGFEQDRKHWQVCKH